MKFTKFTICFLSFFFTLAFAKSANATITLRPPLSLGLVGYWSFEENTGTQAGDSSGNGKNGTLIDGPTWTDGKRGRALSFDGSNDRVSLPTELDYGTAGAISLWLRPAVNLGPSGSSRHLFMANSNAGDDSGETDIYVGNSGAIRFGYWNGSSWDTENISTSATSWQGGRWYHLVATYGSRMELFIDGVSQGTYASTRAPNGGDGSWIASYISQINTSWYGQIDEVRVYNRALGSTEISNLYNSSGRMVKINSSQNSQLTTGLVGMWSFNGADVNVTTNTVYDRAGSANGTINGATPTIGKVGQALSFGGSSDYIGFSAMPTTATNNWSMSAWIKPTVLPDDGIAVSNGFDNGVYGNGYAFGVGNGAGGTGSMLTGLLPGVVFINTGYTFASAGQWYHVVMLRDNGTTKFYVNGTQTANTSSMSVLTPTEFRIGGQQCAGRNFAGAIDEVRIYNRVLTTAEIGQLYNMGK